MDTTTHRLSYGKPIRQDAAKPARLIHTSKPLSRRRRAASSALLVAGAACCLPALAGAQTKEISAVTPSSSKEAGEEFAIKWFYFAAGDTTTGDLNSFGLELRSCGFDGSGCSGSAACGNDFASLCTRDDGVCMDSDGSYDVQIPDTAEAGMYSIKVALTDDPTVFSCTDAFDVTAPADSTVVVEEGEPSMEVMAPEYVYAGEPFTAQWLYDDGAGGAEGTFQVSLHACAGGDCDTGCGEVSALLCEDPGCYDPGTGDYDVVVPADQPLGEYKLQVQCSDDDTSHCSYLSFWVIESDGEIPTLSPSLTPLETPSPVEPRTASPNIPTDAPVAPTDSPSAPTAAPNVPTSSPNAPTAAPNASTGAPNVPAGGPTAPTGVPSAPTETPTSPSVAPIPPVDSSVGEPGSPGTPPTPVPAKVECDATAELEFVYIQENTKLPLITVAHASGDRSEAGCLTLTKLYDWLATAPEGVPEGLLYTVTPSTGVADTSMSATPTGTWLLSTSVLITNGVTFAIKGTAIRGGDCDELKLSSTVKKWNRIMGHGGNIDIDSTYIRSWDVTKMLEHIFKASTDGKAARSYISCVSEVANPDETCDGVAQDDMGECRMDIVDSELAYLGYDSTEAYGVTWKVRGLCSDLSNLDLFDTVRVYGDMTGSDIHHMWYGMYSYGHLGGVWTDNEMHDNHVYGFDPHDDSDYLTIANNVVYDNGNHGIIASKRCDHLLVKDNISRDNGGSGIMLHKSCDDSIVTGNVATNNFDAGLSLVETSDCSVTGNTFDENRWGFRVILGSTANVFDSNTLTANRYNDIYVYYGAIEEVPEVDPFTGINVDNVFTNNVVNYDTNLVVDIEDADGTEVSSNTFVGDGGYFVFLRSTETHVVDNTGEATTGLSDDIEASCFTPESDRLPVC